MKAMSLALPVLFLSPVLDVTPCSSTHPYHHVPQPIAFTRSQTDAAIQSSILNLHSDPKKLLLKVTCLRYFVVVMKR